jgi:hypothetical protein
MDNREEKELENIDSPVFQDPSAEEGTLSEEALDAVAGGMVGYDTVYLTDTQHSDVAHNDPPAAE